MYRGESAGDYDYILVTTDTEFNDTVVDGGTTYYYSVVAVNAVGEGISSAEVSATPESQSAIEVTTTVVSTTTETTILDVTDTPTDTVYFPILVFIASLSIPIYIKRRKN